MQIASTLRGGEPKQGDNFIHDDKDSLTGNLIKHLATTSIKSTFMVYPLFLEGHQVRGGKHTLSVMHVYYNSLPGLHPHGMNYG